MGDKVYLNKLSKVVVFDYLSEGKEKLKKYQSKNFIHSKWMSESEFVFLAFEEGGKLEGYEPVTWNQFEQSIKAIEGEGEVNRNCTCEICTMKREITCIGCGKVPENIAEYKYNPENMSAKEFVIEEEGTLHKFEKDKFYCTECYVEAGTPSITKSATMESLAVF